MLFLDKVIMLKKSRIGRAQKAYAKKDVGASKDAHTKEEIHEEKHTKEQGQYLGDYVYGALDGIITTFAIVSGVEGAGLSNSIVLILGFANILADGISMGVGNYLSTKTELEYIENEKRRELWEIEHVPEGEREEIRAIFKKKGFKGKDLERAVEIITSDKEIWLRTMMLEELGLTEEDKTPVHSGIATFIAFIIAGLVPLFPFVLALIFPGLMINRFLISIILTGIVLFGVGAFKTRITEVNWIRSGIEMTLVGGAAAAVSFFVGHFLRGLGL